MSVQAMQMRGNKRQAKTVLAPLEEQEQRAKTCLRSLCCTA
jgi:hypothetical protein